MLKLLLPAIFALASTPQQQPPASDAPPPQRHERPMGMGNYGVELIDSIHGAGLVKLNGTTVTDLRVDGSLVSKDAQIGSVSVQGEANLRDTSVSGNISVVGSIQAAGSNFQQPITLCTPKATFTRSKIHSLTIRQEKGYKGKQVVELKQGTIVNGPIHFESGKGEVLVDSTSRVNGAVTGGKTTQK